MRILNIKTTEKPTEIFINITHSSAIDSKFLEPDAKRAFDTYVESHNIFLVSSKFEGNVISNLEKSKNTFVSVYKFSFIEA